ncbi:MAG: M20/M25/M40 family metallo-hydrolase [Gemmatimonadota bacterium]|nr:M20/M25/M40 family metallo-hydrolase [Gemmatimonadota bacterium]
MSSRTSGRRLRSRTALVALGVSLGLALPLGAQGTDDALLREATAQLQGLIRLNTTNPPGNELLVARYLDSLFRAEGIESQVYESAPGRGAVVARLRASAPAAGAAAATPLILMGHMDVVGVQRDQWTVDPFAATVRDGVLYGRGAIDDKGMLIANFQAMKALQRRVRAGVRLKRDVIFVGNADEEAGGDFGMGWLLEHHPGAIRAEWALNEGGRTRVMSNGKRYVALQTAEKVSHVVTVTATGPDGHASIPLEGNAISRLGRALAAIGAHREPTVLTPTTTRFFGSLAAAWPDAAEARAMADVASGDAARVARGATVLRAVPTLDAVLRNGISPTILEGGIRSNVIPRDATATLNIRTLPGESLDAVIARLTAEIADPLVHVTVTSRGEDSPAMSADNEFFAAVERAAKRLDPTITVVPYLSTGATDSADLRRAGYKAYGLLPFPLEMPDEERMHGNDERLPLTAFLFGIRFVTGIAEELALP